MTSPERICYGIDASKPKMAMPFVDVPQNIFNYLVDEQLITLPSSKSEAKKLFTTVEPQNNMKRIKIITRRIGRLEGVERNKACASIIDLLDSVNVQSFDNQRDPLLKLDVTSGRLRDGTRLNMSADIQWPNPEIEDSMLSNLTTNIMLQVASDLSYAKKQNESQYMYRSRLKGLVYADVRRSVGVTLQTNNIGGCSIETSGNYYRPSNDIVELDDYNVYSHEQQLILSAGAIAVAHAHELLQGAP